jgi:hypothetical protein
MADIVGSRLYFVFRQQLPLCRSRFFCWAFLLCQQQQVCAALRSGEQPHVSQLPVHSPVIACMTIAERMENVASGLMVMTVIITVSRVAIWRVDRFTFIPRKLALMLQGFHPISRRMLKKKADQ